MVVCFTSGRGKYWRRWPLFGSISAGGFGMLQTSPGWEAAMQLFEQDKLSEAWEIARSEDVGDAAVLLDVAHVIEGEYITGAKSEILTVTDDLEVEGIRSELPCSLEELGQMAVRRRRQVASVLGNLQSRVLVTVLSGEALPPSPFAELGYVRPASQGFKICVSPEASGTLPNLEAAIGSLEASRTAFQMSGGRADAWLIAAAMAASGERVASDLRKSFCAGEQPWLKPKSLNSRLLGQVSSDERMPPYRVARAQAILLGIHLLDRLGPKGLRRLLAFHVPRDPIQFLVALVAVDTTKAACKWVYGYAPEKLFEDALASACL